MRPLIIGAGIAGPILASFLKQAGFEPQVFEAAPSAVTIGGGLSVAPNGMRVLEAAGVLQRVRDCSVVASEWRFENQNGQPLVGMPLRHAERYGHASALMTRAALHRILISHGEEFGIPFHYGKRLTAVQDRPGQPVVAEFADGTIAEGDFIVGADGIRSQVRQAVMPDAPRPTYTGMTGCGGLTPCLAGEISAGSEQPIHFLFGQKAFFGYFNTVTEHGPRTVWWNTVSAPLESREQMAASSQSALRQGLNALHGLWAEPVPRLIESTDEILQIAIHDVSSIPAWSRGRVVLIGDAAHAVAPHSGQGASMALEDALMLAKLLCEPAGKPFVNIFKDFEQQRRPRTDKVIALGRRNGQRKQELSPVAYWIQQQALRLILPLSRPATQDWLFGYRVG